MMRSKKLNQKMTLLTLVVALGVAVYLNWEYAKSTDLALDAAEANAPVTTTGVVTDALAVDGDVETGDKNYGEAQLVSVANDTGSQFFDEARLKREKAHDEALDTIRKTLKDSSLSEDEKAQYTAQMTASLEDINAENEIETLIKAKGFADCLCFLQAGRADLTVMTSGDALTAAQVAQIRDIVMSKSSVTAQNITVVEVK